MSKFGITVEYNGKHYVVLTSEGTHEYAIGEMACELMRVYMPDLKEILLSVESFQSPLEKELMINTLFWLRGEFRKKYPTVISEVLAADFLNNATEYFEASDEGKKEWLDSIDTIENRQKIHKYIFGGSGCDDIGVETIGQFLLTLYFLVSFNHTLFKAAFAAFANADNSKEDQDNTYTLIRMSSEDINIQDIEYRILEYDDRFNSVFTIKSMISLYLFEIAHIYDGDVPIVRCKNCSHYFIPLKRSDTRYCNYPSPENPEKTCKEIGAQKAWANKEKTDDVTREYRKVYMRYKMTVKRHPDNKEAQQKLDRLTDGIREWRQKLEAGEASTADFMRWLEEF